MGMYSGPICELLNLFFFVWRRERKTHCGVEDVNAVCPIVVEGFIYDIPGVALPLVMCDLVGDVVLQSSNEGCICPGARSDLKLSES
jgi:hypothetical protein